MCGIYLLIRVIAWTNSTVVEDHDSITYLNIAKAFLNIDINTISKLDPDKTYFYPFFISLFSMPGWSLETGARIASLVFSIGLFFCISICLVYILIIQRLGLTFNSWIYLL